jgi:hypothetical protein
VINGNIFGGSKIGTHLQLCGRAHYRETRKNLDSINPLSESEELVLGMFKDYAMILNANRRSFFTSQQQQ